MSPHVRQDADRLLTYLQKNTKVTRQDAIAALGLRGEYRLGPALRLVRQELGVGTGTPVLAALGKLEVAQAVKAFLNGTRRERSYNANRVSSHFGSLQAAAVKWPHNRQLRYKAKCYRIARLMLINAQQDPVSDLAIIREITHFLSVPVTQPVTAHMMETWREQVH